MFPSNAVLRVPLIPTVPSGAVTFDPVTGNPIVPPTTVTTQDVPVFLRSHYTKQVTLLDGQRMEATIPDGLEVVGRVLVQATWLNLTYINRDVRILNWAGIPDTPATIIAIGHNAGIGFAGSTTWGQTISLRIFNRRPPER